jgi:hypothetical protein
MALSWVPAWPRFGRWATETAVVGRPGLDGEAPDPAGAVVNAGERVEADPATVQSPPRKQVDKPVARSERQLLAILLTVGFLLFAIAIRLRTQHGGPAGDEPAYLVISQTLQKYHSVDVMKDYLNGDYRSFAPGHLDPHVVVAPNGRLESLHSLGGPLLWLIPFMFWGRLGALGFIAVVSLLIVGNLYYFLRERGIEVPYAFGVTLLLTIGSPIYIYASMAFIEPIGALLILYAMRVLLSPRLSTTRLATASIGLAYMPWVHPRFLLFTLTIGALLLYRIYRENGRSTLRPYLWLVIPTAISLGATEVYNLVWWGTLDPVSSMSSANAGPFQVSPITGGLGVLFDRQVGLITNFPIFVFLLPGLLLSMNRSRLRLQAVLLVVMLPYLLLICTFSAWWAGYSPSARYVMVVLPLMSFYLAAALQRLNSAVATCAAVVLAIAAYALALTSDIMPNDRFAAPGAHNVPMDHLSRLFRVHFVNYLPSAFQEHQEHRATLFYLWFAATVGFGVAVWLVGRRRPALPGETWPPQVLSEAA